MMEAIGFSFANAFSALGIRKDFIDANTLVAFPTGLKILAVAQTIVSTALLFLFGLGLKNRLRMR